MPNPRPFLITRPAVDFGTFLGLTNQALGYSLATASDSTRRELSDSERFLSCLAAMKDADAPVGLLPKLYRHVCFSMLVIAEEADLLDILEACGSAFVVSNTIARGVQIAVVTGTLDSWRDAVVTGSSPSVQTPVRDCFNKIHGLFVAEGLNVWSDYKSRTAPDQTFYLEDRRLR